MKKTTKSHWSRQPNREETIAKIRKARLDNPSPTQFKVGHKVTQHTLDRLKEGRDKYYERVSGTAEYKEQRRKVGQNIAKEKNPNWKGGISKGFAEGNRLKNAAWTAIRRYMLKEYPACTECGYDKSLVIHHIVDWADTKDDSIENLKVLCRACHINTHRPSIIAGHKSIGAI